MENNVSYDQAYRRARKQVKLLRSWYIHALIFTLVNLFVWSKFLFSGYSHHMPIGMTLGWGLGLFIHGLVAWGKTAQSGPLSAQWEERQIKKILDRQQRPD